MARRYVVPTWNGAAAPKKVKPIEPLRYRISPVEKKIDLLDAKQDELDKALAKGMCPDEYAYLADVLDTERQALALKRDKLAGVDPEPKVRPGKAHAQEEHAEPLVRPRRHGVYIFAAVIILFYIFLAWGLTA